ncbi:hypothetical protein [Alteribacillus persepolensis]|nr:hypothetical protein [Alteribacillus persepolensis]
MSTDGSDVSGEIADIVEEWNVSQLKHPYSSLLIETVEEKNSL